MRKYLKLLVICLIVMFSFTGVVSSDKIVAQVVPKALDPNLTKPIKLPMAEDGSDTDSILLDPDFDASEPKIFGRLDGFQDSNNQDLKFRFQLKVLSYNLGVGNKQLGTAGNNVLTITKALDTSSSKLMQSCSTGAHIRDLRLTVLKSREPDEKQLYVKFDDLQVISYNLITDNENPENSIEEITFNFARIDYELTVYKEDGTPMPEPYKFKYDYKLGRTF